MSDHDNNEPSCIICLGPALHPVRLTCECKFTGCAECLYRWLHSKPQTVLRSNFSAGTCPTCRKVGVDAVLVDPVTGFTEALTLEEMAKRGQSSVVTMMVALGADWHQGTKYGNTPLSAAAGAGHLSTVKMFVEEFHPNVDEVMEKGDSTPFMSACENGHLEVAKYLLSKGANCMKADSCYTPFSAAAHYGHLDIMKLITTQRNFNFEKCIDDERQNPVHEACTKGHLHVLKYLLDEDSIFMIIDDEGECLDLEGHPNKDGETPLQIALCGGFRDCAEYLMNSFPKKCNAKHITKDRTNAVVAAANGGLYDLAKRLVTEFGVDPTLASKDGETAAFAAAYNINKATPEEVDAILDFLKFLAEKGADLTAVNDEGENLLHLGGALKLPICRYLIEEVKLSPWAASKDSTTPMYVVFNRAVKETEEYAMQVITYLEEQCHLQEHPIDYNAQFSDDLSCVTFLHLAVNTSSIAIVQYVLHQLKLLGVAVAALNKGNEEGNTPLHDAVGRETHDVVSLLLREGANPNVVNDEKQSCLHLIAARRDGAALEMLKVFIGYWGTATSIFVPDGDGRTILHYAVGTADSRRRDMRKRLQEQTANRKAGDPLPPSPDEVADRAEEFALEVVKFLLAHPSCTPKVLKVFDSLSGYNILHEVVSVDDPQTLRFLLKHLKAVAEKSGETLDAYNVPDDCDGNYPIHIAADYDHYFVAKILLDQFPSSKKSKNGKGKTPAALAEEDAMKKLLS